MFLNLSTNTMALGILPLAQTIELAVRYGFAGIDLPVAEVAALPEPRTAAAELAEAGLEWGCFYWHDGVRDDDESILEAGLPTLARYAAAAQAVGCTRCCTFLFPGHDELDYAANLAAHARRLRRLCEVLGECGVRLAIEYVGPTPSRARFAHAFVHSLPQVLELIAAIDADNAGVLLDTFHWHAMRESGADIRRLLNHDRVVFVHLNDARPGRTPEEQVDSERALPGTTGVIDLANFLAALRDAGYDGPVAAEPKIAAYREMATDAAVSEVAAAMHAIAPLL